MGNPRAQPPHCRRPHGGRGRCRPGAPLYVRDPLRLPVLRAGTRVEGGVPTRALATRPFPTRPSAPGPHRLPSQTGPPRALQSGSPPSPWRSQTGPSGSRCGSRGGRFPDRTRCTDSDGKGAQLQGQAGPASDRLLPLGLRGTRHTGLDRPGSVPGLPHGSASWDTPQAPGGDSQRPRWGSGGGWRLTSTGRAPTPDRQRRGQGRSGPSGTCSGGTVLRLSSLTPPGAMRARGDAWEQNCRVSASRG